MNATTPCPDVLELMALTSEPVVSLVSTSTSPMVTPLILKPLSVVPAAIFRSVLEFTVADAEMPKVSLN